jgi:N-methylhydantoinase A
VVPQLASVFSAAGLISSDLVYSFVKSDPTVIPAGGRVEREDLDAINAVFNELDARASRALDQHGVPEGDRRLAHVIEMSYLRQILDFGIEAPPGNLTLEDLSTLVRQFDERYTKIYGPGAAAPESGYTLKSYKVIGTGRIARSHMVINGLAGHALAGPKARRTSLVDPESGQMAEVAVFDGLLLAPGAELVGPAIIEFPDTNILVPVDCRAGVDEHRNIQLEVT